jgi:RNA recognition motif-containing protein
VIKSKIIGQPFGYGFVEIGSTEKAGEAIMALTGIQLEGQKLDASSLPGSSPW